MLRVCLLGLTALFFLLTLYDILQANTALFHMAASPFWSARILDASTSATLFITVLGALLVRHQFAVSLLPRIDCKSAFTARVKTEGGSDANETWRVEILNTGLGSAVINQVEYFIEIDDSRKGNHPKSFAEVINIFSSIQLIRGYEYWIENITSNFSFSPKDTCPVFEIKTEHLKVLKRLMMVVYYRGQLGNKYRSEICLTPRF